MSNVTKYYAEFQDGNMLMGRQDFDMTWAQEHDKHHMLPYLHKEHGFRTPAAAKRCPGFKEKGTGIVEITFSDGKWTQRRIEK